MKKKHSIRTKMTVVFSVVLLLMLGACWLVNNIFLERYYVQNKQDVLVKVYGQLDAASVSGGLETDEFVQRLNVVCEANDISLFVMGSDGHGILSSVKDSELLRSRLYMYLFSQFEQPDDMRVLQENDDYTVYINVDRRMNVEYLEMVGTLDNGEVSLLRMAVEPIRESVTLANRFLGRVGIAMFLIGIVLIRILSRQIAEPILELAKLSERMCGLDFNVKFSGKGDDEITFLGSHMNQLSETLEKTISELKTANNELKRDIERREKNDEMRREFLSNVSHELKTPIALIQGYAEGLKECINDDQESRDFYCEVIMDESAKMNQMVKNLLTLNELEFGSEVVTMEHIDVTAMLRNMLQSTRILFEQKQARLVFDVKEPVFVWADEYKLEEVLTNYISNALNHVGGERVIKITIQKKEDLVRIGVFNTGEPIPEADIGHIWDKFYKVDKARTREYGGSGVGLSIVKAIMESMHQNYGVVNYENGVEFWLELDSKAETM